VPNDWCGEQFDLWSTVISVEGQRLRAAIAFRGPSRFRPMTIASLGKNGDQIDRLAPTAADLMVVQRCHTITAPVVNMLRASARRGSSRLLRRVPYAEPENDLERKISPVVIDLCGRALA
jgi:hypothetical protein